MHDLSHHVKTSVLIVVPSLECGGLERNVANLCNHINTERFDVTLAVIDHSKPFYTIQNPAVKLIDLQCKRVRQSVGKIRSLMRTLDPDLALCAANHLNLMLAIFRPLFPRHIPLIARESSVVSVNTRRTPWPWMYEKLLRIFYRKLDMIICQSVFMQEDLVYHYRVPKEKTCIRYNSVQIPEAPPDAADNDPVARFLSVTRLSEEKGVDRILRALALLTIPFRYTLVGDGPEKTALKKLAAELGLQNRVHFTGSLSAPYTALPSPDLFLMGSHYEGFPNVLIEANALGIPVVAYRAPGGIPEVVEHGKNGLLVDGQSPEDLAVAIEAALNIPFNREKIKTDTRKRYDAATIAREWENLFLDLASRRHKGK